MPLLFPPLAGELGRPAARFLQATGRSASRGSNEMWRSYRSLTESENRRAFLRTMRAVIDPGGQSVSAMDRLYLAGGLPTLIVWGDQDRIIPVAHAFQAQAAMPHSRLVVLEGVGPLPHAEVPDRFVDVLVDFVDSTEAAAMTGEDLRRTLQSRGRRSYA